MDRATSDISAAVALLLSSSFAAEGGSRRSALMSCSLVGEMRRRPSSDRVMERYHGIFTGESRSQSLTSTQLEVRSTPRRLSLVGRTAEAVPCAQSVCCSSRDKIFFGVCVLQLEVPEAAASLPLQRRFRLSTFRTCGTIWTRRTSSSSQSTFARVSNTRRSRIATSPATTHVRTPKARESEKIPFCGIGSSHLNEFSRHHP